MQKRHLDLLPRRDGRVAQGIRQVGPAQRGRETVEVHRGGGGGGLVPRVLVFDILAEVGLGRDLVRGLQHVRRAQQLPAQLRPELPLLLRLARQRVRRRRRRQAPRLRLAREEQHPVDGAARRHPAQALQHRACGVEVGLLHRRREEELVHVRGNERDFLVLMLVILRRES